jgi:hypothetical protein
MLITFIDLMAKKYQPYTTEFEDSKEKVLTIEQNSKKSNFPIHNKKGSIHQPPFFNITKLSDKFFNSLFILLNSNGIIDISGTFEEEANKFYYLFKSPNPWNGDYSIQFSVNNLEVALIFDELKNYIKNLTPTNIEKCKCFFKISNETKSPFLRGDLFTALGKAKRKIKENPDWIRPEIQLVIDEIKKLAKKYRRSLS